MVSKVKLWHSLFSLKLVSQTSLISKTKWRWWLLISNIEVLGWYWLQYIVLLTLSSILTRGSCYSHELALCCRIGSKYLMRWNLRIVWVGKSKVINGTLWYWNEFTWNWVGQLLTISLVHHSIKMIFLKSRWPFFKHVFLFCEALSIRKSSKRSSYKILRIIFTFWGSKLRKSFCLC